MIWAALALVSAFLYSLSGKGGDFPGQPINPANVKTVFGKPAFWSMVVLLAVAMGGNAGIFSMLPLFLIHEHGLSLSTANTLIGLAQVLGMMMIFAAGWLTDKIGQKRVMGLALVTTAVATVLLGQTTGRLMVTLLFIQPVALGSFFPAALGLLARITPPHLRSVTNALGPGLGYLLGGGLLPLLIGYLGATQTFALGITLAGVFMLAALPLILTLKPGEYDEMPGC
jgi:NNP family nitrate/nitrite transporter-like MFS transporter